ncbi:MAG: hypothetical protein R3321_09460, partial [Nitrososphaeraceae archaeon]|nr:hypothetical protein [Nitrososphaeraceae archaeon]
MLIKPQVYSNDELDSLYNICIQLRAPELSDYSFELNPEDKKCGFEIINRVRFAFDQFTIEQQKTLQPLLQRPVMHKSIISPSGFFKIHFDTSGFNIPSYNLLLTADQNASLVAEALDSTYRFEIDFLGYPNPPADFGEGGDDLYDIYIINQGGSLYGYTQFENEVTAGTNKFTSYMVLDNSFAGYFSQGVDGLNVTVAHEFHHSVQGGNYILRFEDTYFYEITSTALEEFVYDDVNDYYQYLDSYFRRTDLAMPMQNGYNLAIWNLFLQENFDFEIIKRQWELMPTMRAVLAINQSLLERNSSFPRELNKFGIWTYFTNYRYVPGNYFKEAINYPVIIPTSAVQFTPPSQNVLLDAQATSNNFISFSISSMNDTLVAIISNGDAFNAIRQVQQMNFEYTLFSDPNTGERELTENYSSTFNTSNKNLWSVSEILNNIIVREDSSVNVSVENLDYAFPNPFYYTRNYLTGSFIFFPV